MAKNERPDLSDMHNKNQEGWGKKEGRMGKAAERRRLLGTLV